MKFTIKQARQYRGLTQKEAARMLGIALVTYRDYEWNKIDMRVNIAQKFSKLVGIPMDKIIFVPKK